MPTITIDAYLSWYQERADLDYYWAEEGLNKHGLRSHSTVPGDGAQYDPTRATQYAVFGWRFPERPGYRRIPNFPAEGPHETCGVVCFAPAIDGVELTSAYLTLQTQTYTGNSDVRLYGVAADTFTTRVLDACDGYPLTYRAEFHQATWGKPRRCRADSVEYEQEHTEAEVTWHWSVAGSGSYVTPDISDVLNEILARDGWATGNRLALILAPNDTVTPDLSAPDLSNDSLSAPMLFEAWDSVTPPRLTLNY